MFEMAAPTHLLIGQSLYSLSMLFKVQYLAYFLALVPTIAKWIKSKSF